MQDEDIVMLKAKYLKHMQESNIFGKSYISDAELNSLVSELSKRCPDWLLRTDIENDLKQVLATGRV